MPLIKPSPRPSIDKSTRPESEISLSPQPSSRGVGSLSPSSPSPKKQRSWTSFGSRASTGHNQPSHQNPASTTAESQNRTSKASPSRSPDRSRPSRDSPRGPAPQRAPPPPPAPYFPIPQRTDSLTTHNNSTSPQEDPFFRPPLNTTSSRPVPNFSWKLGAQPRYPRRHEPDALNDPERGPLSPRKKEENRREGERDRRWD